MYIGFIVCLIAGVSGYGISHIYGMSIYPDEFGYWSSAAALVGWDWTSVASMGSYYSFGYSGILFPALGLTTDSVAAYRMAVGINFILLCIAFILFLTMAKKLFPALSEAYRIFCCGIAVLYPAWLMYAQTTMTEPLLSFLVILTGWFLLMFSDRPRWGTGIAAILSAIFAYTVHMRGIGILVACVLTVILWGMLRHGEGKKVLILLGLAGAAFLAVFAVKELVRKEVFSKGVIALLNGNDYSGQTGKLQFLFTIQGIRNLIVNTAGKFLYMGFSGAGLVYWGLYWCLGRIGELTGKLRRGMRKGRGAANSCREVSSCSEASSCDEVHLCSEASSCGADKADSKEDTTVGSPRYWLGIFFFLAFVGQMAVCGIYTIGNDNLDWLIYGRYTELVVPIFLFAGIHGMAESRHLWKIQRKILIFHTCMAVICLWAMQDAGYRHIRGEHSVVTSLLIGDGDVIAWQFILQVWLLGSVFSLLLTGLVWQIRQRKSREWLFSLVLLVEVAVGLAISEKHVYSSNRNMRMDLAVVEMLRETEYFHRDILFLKEGEDKWVGFLQMQLRDKSITVIEPEKLSALTEEERKETVLLAYYNSEYMEELSELYGSYIMADVYYLFYE